MIEHPTPLLQPTVPWFDTKTGKPLPPYFQYLLSRDLAMRATIEATNDHETRILALETP